MQKKLEVQRVNTKRTVTGQMTGSNIDLKYYFFFRSIHF